MWLPISSSRHFKSMRRTTWQTKISSCHIMADDNERQCRVMGLSLKMRQGVPASGRHGRPQEGAYFTYANARLSAQLLLQGPPQVQLDFSSDEANHTVVCI